VLSPGHLVRALMLARRSKVETNYLGTCSMSCHLFSIIF